MDCTTVYHDDTINEELRENGTFDVEGGYAPNSLKENARKAFERPIKSRRNMKSSQTQVAKEAGKPTLNLFAPELPIC